MDLPQCFYRVSIKGLILDETRTKFLAIQEASGIWEIPGGGLDHGEAPKECLRREVKEEMGLEVTWIADAPSFFISCYKKSTPMGPHWSVNVLYEMKLAHLDITPTPECVAVRFVTSEEALALPAIENVHEFAKLFQKSQTK